MFQPVLIRSSQQWFIDVSSIGKKCADIIDSGDVQISGCHAGKWFSVL
jgi:isoleucyl-tRNA synthetase